MGDNKQKPAEQKIEKKDDTSKDLAVPEGQGKGVKGGVIVNHK